MHSRWTDPSASRPARPLHAPPRPLAVRCRAPTRQRYIRVWDSIRSRMRIACKEFKKDRKATVHWFALRNEERARSRGFPDTTGMKRVCTYNWASARWSITKNEERPSSRGQAVDKAVVNHQLCSSIGLNGNSVVRVSRVTPRRVFSCLVARGSIAFKVDRPVGVPSCTSPPRSAPPPRRALPGPDPPAVYPGLGFHTFPHAHCMQRV